MLTTIVDHPLAQQALTTLRDQDTDRAAFRAAMDELAGILVYEATRQVRASAVQVTTPMATTNGVHVVEPPHGGTDPASGARVAAWGLALSPPCADWLYRGGPQ